MAIAKPQTAPQVGDQPGPDKVYGLMGVVRGQTPKVGQEPSEMAFTWPHLVIREAFAFAILFAVLTIISIYVDAPLEEMADPALTPNPAKAPWYFLGLQELLYYMHPLLAGIIVPGVAIGALVVLPYLDKNPSSRPRDRKLAITVFLTGVFVTAVLTVIGTLFRGPNWGWTLPWVHGIF